ncbi:MAG: class D sortase [Acidobacteriia bacterium]|nr:class D sortase [Terriglobia bacterium]
MFPMRAQSFLHRSRYLFFIIGTLALAYCGYAPLDAKLYQAYETRQFQEELRGLQSNTSEPVGALPLPPMEEAKPARVESLGPNDTGRSPLGRIEISTIGLSAMILEGIDQRTLRRAVGHIPGTPLPGQPGNVALAGHRDTFFRALRNVRDGDEIMLETLSGLYRYRVDSILVVDPGRHASAGQVRRRNLDPGDLLSVFIRRPRTAKRFIVRAHRPAGNSGRACQGRYHGARNTMSISSQVPLSIPTPIERPAHISE